MRGFRPSRETADRRAVLARGVFDGVRLQADGHVLVHGWMLTPRGPFGSYELRLDGRTVGENRSESRPDVGRAFPQIRHAERSGFRFLVADVPEEGVFEVIGTSRSEQASIRTSFRLDLDRSLALPPEHLRIRVTNNPDAHYYLLSGLENAAEFSEQLATYVPVDVPQLLDWGCGCGRIASHLAARAHVVGVDVDEEAVDHCRRTIEGEFRTNPFEPPTDLPAGRFDAAIGYSVLTHIDRYGQRAWLAEMRRVLRPGGMLIVTVQGDFAAEFNPAVAGALRREGIFDATPDPGLDGIAPPGYYRAVFQSREYVEREFAADFEVVSYVPAGASNYHDLVVLERR